MKISIVTVAFNAAETIGDTLRSVAAQTHPEIEHIVVDGGSRDATMAVVSGFPHVATAISEPDKGIYDAMNKGLRHATGDAVGFLNADDFYARADAVALIAAGLEQSGADAVMGNLALVDQADTAAVRRFYSSAGYRAWMLRFGHMPPHPTLYIRRGTIARIGEFDPGYRIAGDFEMTVRLFRSGARVHPVPHTLVGFRDGGMSTRDVGAKIRMNREILDALRRNGVASSPALLWARYPFKALQFLARAPDYRVPDFIEPAPDRGR